MNNYGKKPPLSPMGIFEQPGLADPDLEQKAVELKSDFPRRSTSEIRNMLVAANGDIDEAGDLLGSIQESSSAGELRAVVERRPLFGIPRPRTPSQRPSSGASHRSIPQSRDIIDKKSAERYPGEIKGQTNDEDVVESPPFNSTRIYSLSPERYDGNETELYDFISNLVVALPLASGIDGSKRSRLDSVEVASKLKEVLGLENLLQNQTSRSSTRSSSTMRPSSKGESKDLKRLGGKNGLSPGDGLVKWASHPQSQDGVATSTPVSITNPNITRSTMAERYPGGIIPRMVLDLRVAAKNPAGHSNDSQALRTTSSEDHRTETKVKQGTAASVKASDNRTSGYVLSQNNMDTKGRSNSFRSGQSTAPEIISLDSSPEPEDSIQQNSTKKAPALKGPKPPPSKTSGQSGTLNNSGASDNDRHVTHGGQISRKNHDTASLTTKQKIRRLREIFPDKTEIECGIDLQLCCDNLEETIQAVLSGEFSDPASNHQGGKETVGGNERQQGGDYKEPNIYNEKKNDSDSVGDERSNFSTSIAQARAKKRGAEDMQGDHAKRARMSQSFSGSEWSSTELEPAMDFVKNNFSDDKHGIMVVLDVGIHPFKFPEPLLQNFRSLSIMADIDGQDKMRVREVTQDIFDLAIQYIDTGKVGLTPNQTNGKSKGITTLLALAVCAHQTGLDLGLRNENSYIMSRLRRIIISDRNRIRNENISAAFGSLPSSHPICNMFTDSLVRPFQEFRYPVAVLLSEIVDDNEQGIETESDDESKGGAARQRFLQERKFKWHNSLLRCAPFKNQILEKWAAAHMRRIPDETTNQRGRVTEIKVWMKDPLTGKNFEIPP